MTQTATPSDSPPAATTSLDNAFQALLAYDAGSGRGSLEPIDQAVMAAVNGAVLRPEIESRLIAVLNASASAVAKRYVCRKLAVIGSPRSAATLAGLLSNPQLSDEACRALAALPCPEAAQSLRDVLPQSTGLTRLAVMNALGLKQDGDSARVLIPFLRDPDLAVSTGAAAALGNIATPQAAQALLDFVSAAPDPFQTDVADACLVCAQRLAGTGNPAPAAALYRALSGSRFPDQVKTAARRALESAAGPDQP